MEYKKAVLLDWTISSSYNVNVKYIYNERKKENRVVIFKVCRIQYSLKHLCYQFQFSLCPQEEE